MHGHNFTVPNVTGKGFNLLYHGILKLFKIQWLVHLQQTDTDCKNFKPTSIQCDFVGIFTD